MSAFAPQFHSRCQKSFGSGAQDEILRFGPRNEFSLRQAVTPEDQMRCCRAVYREYLAQGYVRPRASESYSDAHDALPGTVTLFVESRGEIAGTATMFADDAERGMPAASLYGDEIDRLRRAGRRPVEIGRLTLAEKFRHERNILVSLFDALSIYARRLHGATDFVITVNPSHEKFYKGMLLFDKAGTEKNYSAVCGAPAVLLVLDLAFQAAVIRFHHGEGPLPNGFHGGRSFYRRFSSRAREDRIVDVLAGIRHRTSRSGSGRFSAIETGQRPPEASAVLRQLAARFFCEGAIPARLAQEKAVCVRPFTTLD